MQLRSPEIFKSMRQLYPRGEANPGICVDADGAMPGPNCALVTRSPRGFRTIDQDSAALVQKCLFDEDREEGWLFRQCQRIADALNNGEIALAQIHGLRIPVQALDSGHAGDLAFVKAGFNPDEPRVPKGEPHGGEWTNGGDTSAAAGGDTAHSTSPPESSESPSLEGIVAEPRTSPEDVLVPPTNTTTATRLNGPVVEASDENLIPVVYPGTYHDQVVRMIADWVRQSGGKVLWKCHCSRWVAQRPVLT